MVARAARGDDDRQFDDEWLEQLRRAIDAPDPTHDRPAAVGAEPETGPVPGPETAPVLESEPGSEPGPETTPVSVLEPGSGPGPGPETAPEPVSEPGSRSGPETAPVPTDRTPIDVERLRRKSVLVFAGLVAAGMVRGIAGSA